MASRRQINRLPGLLAVKIISQQISLITLLAHQSITPHQLAEAMTNTSRRKSGPPLMRGLGIHENIPVSVIKLTLDLRKISV